MFYLTYKCVISPRFAKFMGLPLDTIVTVCVHSEYKDWGDKMIPKDIVLVETKERQANMGTNVPLMLGGVQHDMNDENSTWFLFDVAIDLVEFHKYNEILDQEDVEDQSMHQY